MQSPFSSAPIVDELWNGLEDDEFYATDGRRWRQNPHPELTLEERLLISFRKQTPPEHSKNVRLVTKGKAAAFFYALSSADQHFWGISASVISRLFKQRAPIYQTKAEVPWAVVLLDGSWRTGYWFDSATVARWEHRWRRREGPHPEDTIYLVGGSVTTCRRDTADAKRFLGSGSLLKLLNELLDEYSSGSSDNPAGSSGG
jgi:hypothetical protein